MVKVLYNLLYYQVVAQLSCSMSSSERAQILSKGPSEKVETLAGAFSLVIDALGRSELYMEDDGASTSTSQPIKFNMNALEQQVQKLCLPFLRVAALLRHYLYQQPLPEVNDHRCSYSCLFYTYCLLTNNIYV